ncbi:hypothetical protein CRUP_008042 [Coryphaenoides rupestris]|nr:hypothetical protein CRUP_008042 [Coryphaenoides rupestris]
MFLPGESWKPDSCSSCVCTAGTISCFTESCPPTSCQRPLLRKGQCCPYCLDSPTQAHVPVMAAACHFNGRQYSDEERWDIDACTHCYCLAGQTLCSTVSCPAQAPPCHKRLPKEGSCCPVCSETFSPTNVPIEKTDVGGAWGRGGADGCHRHAQCLNNHLFSGPRDALASPSPPEDRALSLLSRPVQHHQHHRHQQHQQHPRVLRIAEPEPRFSGYYSMKASNLNNNLNQDMFYSTP